MEHLYHLAQAQLERPSLVTIGVFDGVHKGHQHLIRQLVNEAHTHNRQAVVLTFFPHPDVVLRGLEGRYYLTTPEQKAELLTALGVDCVVTHPFDDGVRQMRAADFVDQLLRHLKMESLWVGADFAMGYKREGNVPFLKAQGAQKGFTVHEIDLMAAEGAAISSTAIRQALGEGQVEQAKAWLGRGYSVRGEVVHGEGRGRQIGYPTANIAVWKEQVIPANGVYAGWANLNGERLMAATSVGLNPTFEGGKQVSVEPYLLDFDRDIYGQQLEVTFETWLRPEEKFSSIEALIEQIGRDVEAARQYLTGQSE
jgi:riboflavin kinase/FMN adenylyltransferase